VRAISDSSGALVGNASYRPYGALAEQSGQADSRGFTAQRLDGTGLHYLHARYYDAVLARFIGPDVTLPVTQNIGLNRYAYAIADPVNHEDRNGMGPDDDSMIGRAARGVGQFFWDVGSAIKREIFSQPGSFSYDLNKPIWDAQAKYKKWTDGNRRTMARATGGWSDSFLNGLDSTGGIGLGVPVGTVMPPGAGNMGIYYPGQLRHFGRGSLIYARDNELASSYAERIIAAEELRGTRGLPDEANLLIAHGRGATHPSPATAANAAFAS
jgi:RHS repeat-associated protein